MEGTVQVGTARCGERIQGQSGRSKEGRRAAAGAEDAQSFMGTAERGSERPCGHGGRGDTLDLGQRTENREPGGVTDLISTSL